ncbi:hypothetical protein AAVH_34395, partial [Aphelenchoides avenae]
AGAYLDNWLPKGAYAKLLKSEQKPLNNSWKLSVVVPTPWKKSCMMRVAVLTPLKKSWMLRAVVPTPLNDASVC